MPPNPCPTDERLRHSIAKRMRMNHIYQPLMLMELLGRRSPAPAQDVARRNRRAWWARFTFNGITRYERGTYDLVGGVAEGFCAAVELSDAERDQLLQLCRQRLDAFRMQRGEEVFAHRSRHRTPVSGSIECRVLTRARGRCECCGAGCCLANPASKGPGGGPHRAEEPGRVGRHQQPSVPLLPLQRRQAMGGARQAVCSARWRPAAGCCWRTNWRCASPMPIG